MHIVKVKTKKQMQAFVLLPKVLHGQSRCFAPPLWIDERKAYFGRNNPILSNSDFELFLLVDEKDKAIGRTLAYIDFNHNRYYNSDIGFFGAFECIDDRDAGALLVKTAEDWLHEKGMDTIRGPINPVAENWGFLSDDYETPPVYMSPWNPAYYHSFFTCCGYSKAKDLLVYEANTGCGYTLPKRFDGFLSKYLTRNPNIRIRQLDMHNLKEDAKAILEISNAAYCDNWGYVPLELPVMQDMLNKLKLIVDIDAVWIVEDKGRPVGYCLGFPDINIILKRIKGRLFPFGFLKLLLGYKKLKDYRLFGLAVHPDYHGRALDALMYIKMYEKLAKKNIRMEANYILEDNLNIKNALERLGMKYIKSYRIYDKPLAGSSML